MVIAPALLATSMPTSEVDGRMLSDPPVPGAIVTLVTAVGVLGRFVNFNALTVNPASSVVLIAPPVALLALKLTFVVGAGRPCALTVPATSVVKFVFVPDTAAQLLLIPPRQKMST